MGGLSHTLTVCPATSLPTLPFRQRTKSSGGSMTEHAGPKSEWISSQEKGWERFTDLMVPTSSGGRAGSGRDCPH